MYALNIMFIKIHTSVECIIMYIDEIDVVVMVFISRCVSALVVEFHQGGYVSNSVNPLSSMHVLIFKQFCSLCFSIKSELFKEFLSLHSIPAL